MESANNIEPCSAGGQSITAWNGFMENQQFIKESAKFVWRSQLLAEACTDLQRRFLL